MIRCPKCNALNRESSRFCDQCGAPLKNAERVEASDSTDVFSPKDVPFVNDTHSNKGESSEDEDSATRIKGLSLPSKPRSAEKSSTGTGLTGWLSGLEPDESTLPSSQEEENSEDAGLPDWLADLMPEAAPADSDFSAPAEDNVEEEELPDWLGEISSVEMSPAPEADIETRPESSDNLAPDLSEEDWLSSGLLTEAPEDRTSEGRSAEVSEAGEHESRPASLAQPPPEARSPKAPAAFASDLPDWLEVLSDTSLQIEASPVSLPLPDWIVEMTDHEGSVTASGTRELPAWIEAMSDSDLPVSPQFKPGTSKDLGPDEGPSDVVSGHEPEAEELPDWLSELAPEEEAEAPEAVAPAMEAEEGELPDWLSGLAPEEEEETPEAVAPAMEAEAPEVAPPAMEAEAEERPAPALPELDMDEGEMPDWLMGLAPGATETVDRLRPGEEGALAAEAEEEEELPDWLKHPVGEEGAERLPPSELELAEEEAFEASPEMEALEEEEEIPDWLLGFSESERPSSAGEGLPADELVRAEVPEWLQQLRPPGTGPLPEEGADIERPGAEAALATEEEAEGAYPSELDIEFDVPPEEEGGPPRADIPEWVRVLRPTGREPRKFGIETPGPTEAQGPLQGLRGTLPPTTIMDVPSEFQPSLRPTIPQNIIEQARLWQELLEQPRGTERIIKRPRVRLGWRETVSRLLVTAVLLVAVFIAIALVSQGQFISRAPQSAGAQVLREAIDTLQAGDKVIVAVEYGASQATEMDYIANALFSHLRDRDVHVILASTQPEGVGLAEHLAATTGIAQVSTVSTLPSSMTTSPPTSPLTSALALSPTASITTSLAVTRGLVSSSASMTTSGALTSTRSVAISSREGMVHYLPGSASGVLDFLQSTADADMLLVLAASPERLRWWIEQNVVVNALPVGMGVSASTMPLIAPYLETRETAGWIVGLADVVAYHESRGLRFEHFSGKLDALMLTHWAAVGLLVLGSIYSLIAGRKGAG